MQERMKKQAEVTSDTPMGGLPSVSGGLWNGCSQSGPALMLPVSYHVGRLFSSLLFWKQEFLGGAGILFCRYAISLFLVTYIVFILLLLDLWLR